MNYTYGSGTTQRLRQRVCELEARVQELERKGKVAARMKKWRALLEHKDIKPWLAENDCTTEAIENVEECIQERGGRFVRVDHGVAFAEGQVWFVAGDSPRDLFLRYWREEAHDLWACCCVLDLDTGEEYESEVLAVDVTSRPENRYGEDK